MSPPEDKGGAPDDLILPLHAEQLDISRRGTQTRVRVSVETTHHERQIDEALSHERVVVERVPIGRIVDAVPDIREDGDTTILPVVEEILVVEKRLILREEVHVRRVRSTSHHVEIVVLKKQEVAVSRSNVTPGVAETDATGFTLNSEMKHDG